LQFTIIEKFISMTAEQFYQGVDSICISGLGKSLNPKTNVFDIQIMDKKWANTIDYYPTEDLTSTAICLIGLTRSKNADKINNFNLYTTLEALFHLFNLRQYLGSLGLVIWANAVCNGSSFKKLLDTLDVSEMLISNEISKLTTMEVAWLVSGLSHEYHRSEDHQAKRLLDHSVNELTSNRYCPRSSIMSHASKKTGSFHSIRRWISNFADQIYSIQSLAFSYMLNQDSDSIGVANDVAREMANLQGSLGQWWWHYDAKRGGTPQPYSVYSVHQHGMAPMSLRALEKAGGMCFEDEIGKSRNWLNNNELGINLIDSNYPTIWRSIEYDQGKILDYARKTHASCFL
jgi:hypothetical protein